MEPTDKKKITEIKIEIVLTDEGEEIGFKYALVGLPEAELRQALHANLLDPAMLGAAIAVCQHIRNMALPLFTDKQITTTE